MKPRAILKLIAAVMCITFLLGGCSGQSSGDKKTEETAKEATGDKTGTTGQTDAAGRPAERKFGADQNGY